MRAFERLAGGIATLASRRDEILALRRRLKEEQRDKARVAEERARARRECDKAGETTAEAVAAAETAYEKFLAAKKEAAELQRALEEGRERHKRELETSKERHKREMDQKTGEVARLQRTLLEHKTKVLYLQWRAYSTRAACTDLGRYRKRNRKLRSPK